MSKYFSRSLIKSIGGVSASSAINFFSAAIFLPLAYYISTDTPSALNITNAVIALSFVQILDGTKIPILSYFKKNDINSYQSFVVNLPTIYINSLLLWLMLYLPYLVYWVLDQREYLELLLVFLSVVFALANGVMWAWLDFNGRVHVTYILRALVNLVFFVLMTMLVWFDLSENALKLALCTPMLYFLILVPSYCSIIEYPCRSDNSRYLHSRTKLFDVGLIRNSILYLINFGLSTLQANMERLLFSYNIHPKLQFLSVISEYANRMSFVPRILYHSLFSHAIRSSDSNSVFIKQKKVYFVSLFIMALVTLVYVLSYIKFLSAYFYVSVLVYFILSFTFKIFSYYASFMLNVNGDFYTQPFFTFLWMAVLGLCVFFGYLNVENFLGFAIIFRFFDCLLPLLYYLKVQES